MPSPRQQTHESAQVQANDDSFRVSGSSDAVQGETPVSQDEEVLSSASTDSDKPPLSDLFGLNPESATDEQIQEVVQNHIEWEVARSPLRESQNILFLYDSSGIARGDANRIYQAVSSCNRDRKTLLVIHSPGGEIAAAYFIAKLCRESSRQGFEAVVPRLAKSAATLICCGANAIHMGSMSELGPIDPQFGHIPALALKHSVEHIAQLASEYPAASEMLGAYLSKSLRIESLGFYERVAESAAQYAERLLGSRRGVARSDQENSELARRLVYAYKDHGFVIDSNEASAAFGNDVVMQDTPEYQVGNKLYGAIDLAEFIVSRTFKRGLVFTGACKDACLVLKRE